MAYSDFEQSFMDSIARTYFPGERTASEPVQVAAASGATATDAPPSAAGSAPEIKSYDPTTREKIASFLQSGFEGLGMERSQARKHSQSLIGGPLSGAPIGLGVADFVSFLGTALQTEEAVRMMDNAATLADQGKYGDAAIEAGAAAIGLIPGASGTIKHGKKAINKAKEIAQQESRIKYDAAGRRVAQ